MSNETEVDMKDVELNEVDQEKQPMTAGEVVNNDAISPVTEKNGIVKVKIPEEETKFTGLSKEELLKVAGTPGWIRIRWALLILFWLGWIGMLAGAIAIIVQAPRCKPIPEMNWWNYGPLYQIGDVKAFTQSSNLEGLAKKVGDMDQLKVKGLVIGPVHVSADNKPEELKLDEISQEAGNLDQFKEVIREAHRRGISVVLDLTPNYKGVEPWFNKDSISDVAVQVKSALIHWLETGVDGFLFYGVDVVSTKAPSSWNDINAIVHNQTETGEGEKKKVLIGVTDKSSTKAIADLLNSTGVDLLLSGALRSKSALEIAQTVDDLYSTYNQTSLAWNIGERVGGHLASLVGRARVKLGQLLLLTLPGTPVLNYGDEIGLEDETSDKSPLMVWQKETNETSELMKEMSSFYTFFKEVSHKRMKERSLLHGEYLPLFNSTSALAYVRKWDQNERYLIAINWDKDQVSLNLKHDELPEQATVVFSTAENPSAGEIFNLAELKLEPYQGVMLKFPYTS